MLDQRSAACTRFERLFDQPDALVALWLVAYWRSTSRATDENLHRAARGMINRGELAENRWRDILREAEEFERIIEPHVECDRLWSMTVRVPDFELAIAAGVPLTDRQQQTLRGLIEHLRGRSAPDEIRERARLQGLLSRAIAQANHGVEA